MSSSLTEKPKCSVCSEHDVCGQVCIHCHQITKGFELHDVHGTGCYDLFSCKPFKGRDVCEYCFVERYAEYQITQSDLNKMESDELLALEQRLRGNNDHYRILAPGHMRRYGESMRTERREKARKRQYREFVRLQENETSFKNQMSEMIRDSKAVRCDFKTYTQSINKDNAKRLMILKYDFI